MGTTTDVVVPFPSCPFAYHLQFPRVDSYVHLRFRSQVLLCGSLQPTLDVSRRFGYLLCFDPLQRLRQVTLFFV